MSIPHCFDHLLGAKPKHPQVGALVASQPVDDIAPPSQIERGYNPETPYNFSYQSGMMSTG